MNEPTHPQPSQIAERIEVQLLDPTEEIITPPEVPNRLSKDLSIGPCKITSVICEAIREPSGERLMELMALVYEGLHDPALLRRAAGASVFQKAFSLGLLELLENHVILTPQGYLVGNVAKEYIHWIDHGRQMPQPCPSEDFIAGKDVLDLGCSFGRWLWQFQEKAKSVVGLEMQQEYITMGRVLAERENIPCPEMLQGSVENLSDHIPDNSIDFVFIRLVLNHVFITKTLKQVFKVLRSNGIVWIQTYSWDSPFEQLRQGDKGRQLRSKAFAAFGIVNSLVFQLTRRQLSLQIQGRMHSVHKPVFPTRRTWKSVCNRIGFDDFTVVDKDVFWVRKP